MNLATFLVSILFAAYSWAAPDCLQGDYDLGEGAAALRFFCSTDESSGTAEITFCKRTILINTGECTGMRDPLPCQWQENEALWLCEEKGHYPLRAKISRLEANSLVYDFKSSFNSGTLIGKRIR